METGGMKGRRREMIREEVHACLQDFFEVEHIHSEYGMTELLSQAYSKGQGKFTVPSSMRVVLRDINDPFSPSSRAQGGINMIDLANFHSCAFVETQDIGKLDEEGFLYIVGRKKEIIVTAGGKNVAPAVLEDRLRSHPLVSQCMVVGDNQPFIAALVTIDPDALKVWVANNKKDGASINDLINDPDLIAVVQTAVDEANKAVSKAESIRKFTILPVDFTIAGGHLTAKLSVKRHVVAKEFAQEIDALFSK